MCAMKFFARCLAVSVVALAAGGVAQVAGARTIASGCFATALIAGLPVLLRALR